MTRWLQVLVPVHCAGDTCIPGRVVVATGVLMRLLLVYTRAPEVMPVS
jgi:hypothetical protein